MFACVTAPTWTNYVVSHIGKKEKTPSFYQSHGMGEKDGGFLSRLLNYKCYICMFNPGYLKNQHLDYFFVQMYKCR